MPEGGCAAGADKVTGLQCLQALGVRGLGALVSGKGSRHACRGKVTNGQHGMVVSSRAC